MQRIRTIKPELFTHELLFDLEQKEGLPIRFAFIGLFTVCDREGRFLWRPRMLKSHILPYDDVDFERILNVLVTNSLLIRYEVDGKLFGCIPTWLRHQKIRPDEAKSVIPEPPADLLKKAAAALPSVEKNVDNKVETNFPLEHVTNPLRTRYESDYNCANGNGNGIGKERSIELTFFTDVKNISSGLEYDLENKIVSDEPVLSVTEEKEKKKKPGAKKETTLFTKLRQWFDDFYFKKYGTAYYFEGAKDAQALNSLIKKLTFKLQSKDGEGFDEEAIQAAFADFCTAAERCDGFIHDKYSLSILSNQFNAIFSQVKSVQNGTSTSKRANRMSEQDAVDYLMQKRAWMRSTGQYGGHASDYWEPNT
jgi:hypothetical protein